MVGGTVIETVDCGEATGEWPTGRIWINCRGRNDDAYKTLGIYVERTAESRSVSPGDSIWWQGVWAFWTPKVGGFSDKKLRRLGGSGAPRPPTLVVRS